MRHIIALSAISLVLSLLSFSAAAKLYKWTDDQGQVHYGQTKPTNYPAVEVNAPPPPPSSAPDLNQKYADQIREAGKQSSQQKDQKTANAANKTQCETARKNMQLLNQGGRISYQDKNGETVYLTDETLGAKKAETQKQIDFFCN